MLILLRLSLFATHQLRVAQHVYHPGLVKGPALFRRHLVQPLQTIAVHMSGSSLSNLAVDSEAPLAKRANCYCGCLEVIVAPTSQPVSSSICHCANCRSLSGAPFLANVLFAKPDVQLVLSKTGGAPPSGALIKQATSKHVSRVRCAKCYSPMLASLGEARVVLPVALFSRTQVPDSWKPKQHIWYDSRVMDVADGVQKFRKNFGSEKCSDIGESVPEENVP